MVTTDDAEWAARLRRLREHGMNASAADRHASNKPVLESYLEVGYNYRMTDVQAAIGLVQLGKLDAMIARRRELAARYDELLRDVTGLTPVRDPAHGQSNFQSYWVLLDGSSPSAGTTCSPRSPRPVSPPGAGSWPRTSNPPTRATPAHRCRSPSGSPGTR